MDKELSHWWDHMTYADAKNFIRDNIRCMARDYIAIGFYLRKVRDEKLFLDGGYASVHEFAYEEFGMRKSTVNHCIRINAKFSEGGNSPTIDARYKEFGRAQLQELLYVPEERRDEVTPDMTVAEIREVHKPKRLDIEPGRDRSERADDEPGGNEPRRLDIEPQQHAGPVQKNATEVSSGKQPGEPEIQEVVREPLVQQHASEQQKILGGARKCVTGWSRYGVCVCCGYGGVSCCNQCGESCNSRCGWIDDPYIPENGADSDVIDAQYREEPVKITVQDLLEQKRRELDEWLEAMEGDSNIDDDFAVPGITKLRIIVQALALLAGQQDSQDGQESEEQIPLPLLRNNDQRKEWLGRYQDWGLWYEDTNIGTKYYRYRFENGADLIVEEYQGHSEYAGDYTASYFHLVGGPDAPRKKHGICGWQRHKRYSKFPNSETELVEFLKFVQKGDR